MNHREVMQQALEALVSSTGELHLRLASPTDAQLLKNHQAITALSAALAEPEQEPVAWVEQDAIDWLARDERSADAHTSTALLLADKLEQQFPLGTAQNFLDGEAAAELRRLHALNQELLEALQFAAEAFEIAADDGGVNFHQYAIELRTAIAKATWQEEA